MRKSLIVARREWMELTRDHRVWWVALLLCALTTASVTIGFQQLRRLEVERATAIEIERQVWLTQERKTPHSAAHHGFYVFQPMSVLAAIDPGLLDYVGHVRHLEAHGEKLPKFTPAEDRPAARQFPLLTAALTLQVVVPLILVMLLYGTLADERESGTLRMLLSSGITPGALGFGKVIGSLTPLTVGLLIAGAVALAVVSVADSGASARLLPRVAIVAISYATWLIIFVEIILLVSSRSRSGRQALLISIAAWFILTVLGPKLAVETATRIHEAPSPQQFLAALREAEKSRPSYWEDLVPAARTRLLAQYGVQRVEDLPVSPASAALLDQEDDDSARVEREFERLNRIHEAQEQLIGRFGWILPMVAVQRISMAAAGTDAQSARDFARQAEDYRRRAVRILNEDSVAHDTSDFLTTGVRYEADQQLWASVPPFQYQAPTLTTVFHAHGSDTVGLALWLVIVTGSVVMTLRTLSPV